MITEKQRLILIIILINVFKLTLIEIVKSDSLNFEKLVSPSSGDERVGSFIPRI